MASVQKEIDKLLNQLVPQVHKKVQSSQQAPQLITDELTQLMQAVYHKYGMFVKSEDAPMFQRCSALLTQLRAIEINAKRGK